jgi:Family of unknown function (DUF5681)
MPTRRDAESAEDAVGFGCPPKATQFKPGKSGNPKGRPKGARSVAAVLQDVIQQKVPVTENGATRRVPALEVMLRRLANDAMRNDPRALKLLLSLVDRYGESSKLELQLEHLLRDDQAILKQYLEIGPVSNPTAKSDGGGASDGP